MSHPRAECFVYELRPGCGPRYDDLHRNVWPEVQQSLRESGITDYAIYRRGELVITVITGHADGGPPPETGNQRRLDQWTALLAPLFAKTSDDAGEPMYADLVFRL